MLVKKVSKKARKKYNKKYFLSHKEEMGKQQKEYKKKYKENKGISINTAVYRKLKKMIFAEVGNKCQKCGFSDLRALQIDHVDGGGQKDRKKNKPNAFLRKVLESLWDKEKKYQILCANCNWIKRVEKNEIKA